MPTFSRTSFDATVQNALEVACRCIQDIKALYLKELRARVGDSWAVPLGPIGKIAFGMNTRP